MEIPLTVLGTVGSGRPDGEIVLVRLDHPRMRETGIIAGMSGSPVYIDGKLLGALAYGWAFASEPIGGVTPFVRMLEVEASPPATAAAPRPQLSEILAAARARHSRSTGGRLARAGELRRNSGAAVGRRRLARLRPTGPG